MPVGIFVCQQGRCNRKEETDDVKEMEDNGWSEVIEEVRSDGNRVVGKGVTLDGSTVYSLLQEEICEMCALL